MAIARPLMQERTARGRPAARAQRARDPDRTSLSGATDDVPAAGRIEGIYAALRTGNRYRSRRDARARLGSPRKVQTLVETIEVGKAGEKPDERYDI
jgi:hypothetical protein